VDQFYVPKTTVCYSLSCMLNVSLLHSPASFRPPSVIWLTGDHERLL